jgi:hypothetical protein
MRKQKKIHFRLYVSSPPPVLSRCKLMNALNRLELVGYRRAIPPNGLLFWKILFGGLELNLNLESIDTSLEPASAVGLTSSSMPIEVFIRRCDLRLITAHPVWMSLPN